MREETIFPIDIDYIVINDKVTIRIFGQTLSGERRLFYDDSFRPYCYILANKNELIDHLSKFDFVTGIEEVEKSYLGRKILVSKVYTKLPEDVPKLKNIGFKVYDADIPFYKRYILDKGISTFSKIKVRLDGDYIKEIVSIEEGNPILNAIAFDIEVFSKRPFPDVKKDPIVIISLFNDKFKKIITWLNVYGDGIEKVNDERELLLKFADLITQYNPDVIVGYNSDNFDFPYINERAEILGVSLKFNGFGIKIKGTRKVAEINGKMHVDIFNFIRNIYAIYNLRTEVLDLNSVSSEMLGEKKDDFEWNKIDDIMVDRDLALKFCNYCLKDSMLTFRIYNKVLDLMVGINKYIGQSLQDVSRMTTGAVVENFLMKKFIEKNEVIPNKPSDFEVNERLKKVNIGAFVYQPSPGLYHNIGVVDFRSLYPSIIVSHNICPSTIKIEGNNVSFVDKDEMVGLIPSVLEIVLKDRVEAKKRLKLDSNNSELKVKISVLKLLANGFYGYLGYYNARWYCFECAGTVTALGRNYVNSVIQTAKDNGFEVIYADTDSAFISNITPEQINSLINEINTKLPYPMELELQGVYKTALFVSAKGKERGAKKKYALVDTSGNLIIKGFQSVRRDWAIIAKETQTNLLKLILVDEKPDEAIKYVRNVINDVRQGKISLDKMVIFTRLHKGLSNYLQAGRHVMAARNSGINFSEGDIVKYVIVKGRPNESISERSLLFDIAKENNISYDPDYYINQQIIPAILQIMEVLGYSKEDILGTKNSSLKGFI